MELLRRETISRSAALAVNNLEEMNGGQIAHKHSISLRNGPSGESAQRTRDGESSRKWDIHLLTWNWAETPSSSRSAHGSASADLKSFIRTLFSHAIMQSRLQTLTLDQRFKCVQQGNERECQVRHINHSRGRETGQKICSKHSTSPLLSWDIRSYSSSQLCLI